MVQMKNFMVLCKLYGLDYKFHGLNEKLHG